MIFANRREKNSAPSVIVSKLRRGNQRKLRIFSITCANLMPACSESLFPGRYKGQHRSASRQSPRDWAPTEKWTTWSWVCLALPHLWVDNFINKDLRLLQSVIMAKIVWPNGVKSLFLTSPLFVHHETRIIRYLRYLSVGKVAMECHL